MRRFERRPRPRIGAALAIVRLIHAALKERDQQSRSEGHPDGLSDAELLEMLQAMVSQRSESIRRYEESGQLELAAREGEEIEVIKRLLPRQLDEAACAEAVSRVIADLGVAEAQGHRPRDLRAEASLSRPDGLRQGAPARLPAARLTAAPAPVGLVRSRDPAPLTSGRRVEHKDPEGSSTRD